MTDASGQRQRAEVVAEQICDAVNTMAYPSGTITRLVRNALQEARQEALREARLSVAGEMCDEPDHACGSLQRILDDIDRLAREGVKG